MSANDENVQQRLEQANEQIQQLHLAVTQTREDLQKLAYAASHDLREPLRAVTGYCGFLKEDYYEQLDDSGRQFLDFVVDGAKRLDNMIDALLEYSRIQTHGGPMGPADAKALLETASAKLAPQLAASNATVESSGLGEFTVDRNQFVQLLHHLIDNAIKFCKQGEDAQIQIVAESDDDQWTFAVIDQGIGIAPENHDRVFDVFQRLHSRERYPGIGMGLSVCKRIIERHGGRIWVESEPEAGATFRFTIPAR